VVATGSPFPDLEQGGVQRPVAQCNNAYIFPGIGLGVLAVNGTRISDAMFTTAARALAAFPKQDPGAVLPSLEQIREVSVVIAIAVARRAVADGLGDWIADDEIDARIQERLWEPRYKPVRLKYPD
jgi:malate dehydrogenase (oxaloacetate-decarboxylating)